MLKTGVALLGGEQVTAFEQIDLIRDAGFDGIFVGWHEKMGEWADCAAKKGLAVTSVHAPYHGVHEMWHPGYEEGARMQQDLIQCVRDTAAIGVGIMVVHPFIGFLDHTPTRDGLDGYRPVVEEAEKRGVRLAFENVEGEEYLAALMAEFASSPAVGFCLDTGHEQCYNGGKDMLSLYGEKLCYVHLDDNLGAPPVDCVEHTFMNDHHFLPGDGIIDWKQVYRRLTDWHYDGYLMLELKRTPTHAAMREHYQAMTLRDYLREAHARAARLAAGWPD